MNKRVMVAMSGGIDSAITAWMLKEQGYQVYGIHFRFFDSNDMEDSKLNSISEQLGIKLFYSDAQHDFQEKVVRYFTHSHIQGRTPSPCVICNPQVKWKKLLDAAREHGCDYLATGHYINIIEEGEILRLLRAKDRKKDQSYYLWRLPQEVLRKALCPLGSKTKDEVKELARQVGFGHLVKKKESAGLCFAQNREYSDLLLEYLPREAIPGRGTVTDRAGNILGEHKGYVYYTIGQKRGMQLNTDQKLCVVAIIPEDNRLVVDTWQSLYAHSFFIEGAIFPKPEELQSGIPIQTWVRGFGLNPEGNTHFVFSENGQIEVQLENPAWAVTPGQPAVFYAEDKLVGGGFVSANFQT